MTEQRYQDLTTLYHEYVKTISPYDDGANSDQVVADEMDIGIEEFHEWEKEWDEHHRPLEKLVKRAFKRRC